VSDLETAFLNAIAEAPDDDAPRLVYADWLDDNGQPARARLIREQCEQARAGLAPAAADSQAVAAWEAVLPPLPGEERLQRGWIFRRGIPEGVRYGPLDATRDGSVWAIEEFLKAADRVLTVPTLREVVIDAKEVAEYEDDRDDRPLEDRGMLGTSLRALGQVVALGRVHRLGLLNSRLLTASVDAPFPPPHLTKLRWLDLSGCDLTTRIPYTLAASPLASRLETLELRGGTFGYLRETLFCVNDAAVRVLARAASFAALTDLDLSGNNLSDHAADALLDSPHLPRLRRLRIAGHSISEDRLRRLRERFPDLSGEEERWNGQVMTRWES
jgi:uncharacterized protein (TIGR02996 family)